MVERILAIDLGTSALKAVVFAGDGRLVASASRPVVTVGAADRSQVQDPALWWSALVEAVGDLPARDAIGAVVPSGSMQNLMACGRLGHALAPAVLYSDRRLEGDEVSALAGRLPDDYARRVGNRLDPAHTILRLMALDRFLPTLPAVPGRRFLFGAKDALVLRMTGRAVCDPTTASTTGLMDIATRRWDPALLAVAGVDPAELPDILPAGTIAGGLLPGAASELGLRAGTPVLAGCGDAAGATWGAHADRPGSAYAYLGTTGWAAATLPMAQAAPPRDIYTLADPVRNDHAIVVSPFLTAGAALDWAAGLCGVSVGTLVEAAQAADDAPPSALFLPYLSGERAPFEDQHVRGALIGLDRGHGAAAVGYVVMEGIAFALRHNLEMAGLPPSPMTVIGGGARAPLARQLLADVLGRDMIVPPDGGETTALGALRMAAPALGLALPDDPAAGAELVRPRTARSGRADRRYRAYLEASAFARRIAAGLDGHRDR